VNKGLEINVDFARHGHEGKHMPHSAIYESPWTRTWERTCRAFAAGLAAFVVLLGLTANPNSAQAQDVSVEFFTEALAPYGDWVDHPRHGRVWHPRDVDYNWRPYTLGRWANTEEHGWMWVSEEEWGWGPYHYGRWDQDERYGWVWVPGDRWGPAWVEWRTGGGHIGWAPLPPAAVWRDDRIFYASTFDFAAPRFRPAWVFVEEVHFIQPRLFVHCLAPARNVTIINRTTNITNYTVVNQTIINKSVNVTRIQQVTKQTVPVVKVAQISDPAALKGNAPGVNTDPQVAVFKPVVANAGKVAIAAGVTAAAVVAAAKVSRANAPAKPAAVSAPQPAPTPASGQPASPQSVVDKGALKKDAAKTQAPAAAAKTAAEPKVTTPKVAAPAPAPTPKVAAPAGEANRQRDALRERQRADQEVLRRRQQEERSKAALIQKPKVVYNQLRERSEQRRIQETQRRVEQNRTAPPPRAAPPAQPKKKEPQPGQPPR
jgi:hypothetical protein